MIASYYDNINDCPMYAFKKGMQGNYRLMRKRGIYTKDRAFKAFKQVFNEADEKFRIAEIYRQYLSKMVRASQFYAKAVSGQRHYFTRAELLIKEADALLDGSEEELEKRCAYLTKKMGVKVSPKSVTVAEFYAYIELKEESPY